MDRTGLSGTFDVDLLCLPEQALNGIAAGTLDSRFEGRAGLFTSPREQLGLKLDSARGPVEVLAIDSAQQPTGN